MPQAAPRWPQDAPKIAPRGPQEAPKRPPRGPQEPPKKLPSRQHLLWQSQGALSRAFLSVFAARFSCLCRGLGQEGVCCKSLQSRLRWIWRAFCTLQAEPLRSSRAVKKGLLQPKCSKPFSTRPHVRHTQIPLSCYTLRLSTDCSSDRRLHDTGGGGHSPQAF